MLAASKVAKDCRHVRLRRAIKLKLWVTNSYSICEWLAHSTNKWHPGTSLDGKAHSYKQHSKTNKQGHHICPHVSKLVNIRFRRHHVHEKLIVRKGWINEAIRPRGRDGDLSKQTEQAS
jgi:hypothetical protein